MDFSVCVKETHGYFESLGLGISIYIVLVRWPINKLVENIGDMLRLK
jgi:hypothetical protein